MIALPPDVDPAEARAYFKPLGAARALCAMQVRDPEVLFEGPAGTGKSRAIGEYIYRFCHDYPGVRVLVFRKTRVSLSESFLVTWENKVLWPEHPVLDGPSRAHRTVYTFENGSEVVLGGMDNPTRLFSQEYDLAYCQEATELSENEWESLHRALRNNVAPYQQLIGDCNPDSEYHWLNRRCNNGKTRRVLTRHADNPSLDAAYLARLDGLTGVRRARLFLGQWVSAEGQIWEDFDPAVHLIDRKDVPELKWYGCSMDFGFRAPGCFQVWGVDKDDNAYRVAEVYRTGQHLDWWASRICELYNEFPFVRGVADSAEPRSIEFLNDRISEAMGRKLVRLFSPADKSKGKKHGLDQVRWALRPAPGEKPRLYLVRDALRFGADPLLVEGAKPTCTDQEIPSYVFLKAEDGKPIKEVPDPTCADHGCDATTYWSLFHWQRDLSEPPQPKHYEPFSFGHILGHGEIESAA